MLAEVMMHKSKTKTTVVLLCRPIRTLPTVCLGLGFGLFGAEIAFFGGVEATDRRRVQNGRSADVYFVYSWYHR